MVSKEPVRSFLLCNFKTGLSAAESSRYDEVLETSINQGNSQTCDDAFTFLVNKSDFTCTEWKTCTSWENWYPTHCRKPTKTNGSSFISCHCYIPIFDRELTSDEKRDSVPHTTKPPLSHVRSCSVSGGLVVKWCTMIY